MIIDAHGLTKDFIVHTKAGRFRRNRGTVPAVRGIELSVQPAEMVGYIGPNGAGKSTTIKMMTGVLSPTSGSLEVLGMTPVQDRVALAKRIGVVFGQRTQLWWDLPLGDSFDLLHAVYRTERVRHQQNLNTFIELLDLGPQLDTPVRQLSLGQRMRGELAAALLHDPELVFLDEPTIGLDVVSKFAVRQFLTELNQERGTTVLLTTHDLADIEHLCERMVIIDKGLIMHDGPLEAFRSTFGSHRTVVVDFETEIDRVHVPNVEVTRTDGPRQWLQFDRTVTTAPEVISAVVSAHQIRDIAIEEPAIEDLVRRLYEANGDR